MKNYKENDSSDPWSFRDKESPKTNELSLIDKITQKVNQTLIKSTQKKPINPGITILDNHEDNQNFIDVFKKKAEKELEIFETERKEQYSQKNKSVLIKIDCTLSDLSLGRGTFVTKDDLILNMPSSFLNKTKFEDIGNSYSIKVTEINRLIPNDEFISNLHSYYSQHNKN